MHDTHLSAAQETERLRFAQLLDDFGAAGGATLVLLHRKRQEFGRAAGRR
jgi:hypothetical protein